MGPLTGIRILELAGIGPGPFCGMMLADMGAEVIRIDRPGGKDNRTDFLCRNRSSIAVDLKQQEGKALVLDLCKTADAIFEGFRPGVAERLGLGPEDCMAVNPKIVYGRMTGWGQDGPMAQAAGHDLNYIALSGALASIGPKGEKPAVPLNLVGDFGGGGMMLAFGMVCALLEAQKSGKGQVIDSAMVDGAATLMMMFYSSLAQGKFAMERGNNVLDGGAHFYDVYETSDRKYVSIGSIEPQFYALLIEEAELDPETFEPQMSRSQWPMLKEKLTEVFKTKTRDQWCDLMEGTDVCFAPVLDMQEAPSHPHNVARNTFVEVEGMVQPAPAPRFSRSVPPTPELGKAPGADTVEILKSAGLSEERIEQLLSQKTVVQA